MRRRRPPALLRLLLAAALAAGCTPSDRPGEGGRPAPAYVAPRLDGDSLSLADLRGQVVLLNVWATWCIPCRKEMPELQSLHEQLAARGLRVVGVSIDRRGADADVRAFLQQFGITYVVLRDPHQDVSFTFNIPGVPSTFLIDRKGDIAWTRLGRFEAADSSLQRALRKAL